MRERKVVKLKVDMYDDTKFKIIDRMDERDLIHYIWTRLITLAGKVNLEGNLYLSKNIPYTVETLAIEFNRITAKVELALNALKSLEMIEFTQDKVYRIKNFAKHQGIKVTKKEETKIEENNEVIKEVIENNKEKIKAEESEKIIELKKENTDEILQNKIYKDDCKKSQKTIFQEEKIYKNHNKIHKIFEEENNNNNLFVNISPENIQNISASPLNDSNLSDNIPPLVDTKKINKKSNCKNKKHTDGINMIEEKDLITFYDGEAAIPMCEGYRIVSSWSY